METKTERLIVFTKRKFIVGFLLGAAAAAICAAKYSWKVGAALAFCCLLIGAFKINRQSKAVDIMWVLANAAGICIASQFALDAGMIWNLEIKYILLELTCALLELTSLNYLSNYIYKAAGLELPAYNQFLEDVRQVIPAINSKGYYSLARGEMISIAEAEGIEAEALQKYLILQYNSLYDSKYRSETLFGTK